MTLSERLSRMLRESAPLWPWPAERKPIRVEHVRYVKKPDRDDIRAKAREMCAAMGREIPEVLRP